MEWEQCCAGINTFDTKAVTEYLEENLPLKYNFQLYLLATDAAREYLFKKLQKMPPWAKDGYDSRREAFQHYLLKLILSDELIFSFSELRQLGEDGGIPYLEHCYRRLNSYTGLDMDAVWAVIKRRWALEMDFTPDLPERSLEDTLAVGPPRRSCGWKCWKAHKNKHLKPRGRGSSLGFHLSWCNKCNKSSEGEMSLNRSIGMDTD